MFKAFHRGSSQITSYRQWFKLLTKNWVMLALHVGWRVLKACSAYKIVAPQAAIKMKPSHVQCPSCETTLNQVEIPKRAREHVIARHYPFTVREEIDPSDRYFLKMLYHHRISLMQSPSSFNQGCKQVENKAIGTFTTTHSVFQWESSLTDKEACVKLTR